MKRIIAILVLLALPHTSVGAEPHITNAAEPRKNADTLPQLPAGQSWKLVWNDEFDGNKLDESKWEVPDHKRRDGWWSPKAVALDGEGHLAISTLKDGDRYLDGCVRTRGKFEHAQGYYVARIKLQNQPGHWSAFWLYNSSVGRIGDQGRDGTEIDIMEKPWRDDRVQHALHWDGYGKEHRSEGHVANTSSTWTARKRGELKPAVSARCPCTSN